MVLGSVGTVGWVVGMVGSVVGGAVGAVVVGAVVGMVAEEDGIVTLVVGLENQVESEVAGAELPSGFGAGSNHSKPIATASIRQPAAINIRFVIKSILLHGICHYYTA